MKDTRSSKRKEKTARRNPKLPYGCCLIRAGSPVKSTAFGKWTVGTNEATNQHTTQRPDTEHNRQKSFCTTKYTEQNRCNNDTKERGAHAIETGKLRNKNHKHIIRRSILHKTRINRERCERRIQQNGHINLFVYYSTTLLLQLCQTHSSDDIETVVRGF